MSRWVQRPEGDRTATVRTLSQRDVCKRPKIERLDLAREQAADDNDALCRDAVIGLSAGTRIDKESANDDVEAKKHERNSPELEKERGFCGENGGLPEYRESAPEQAKRDEKRIMPAEANTTTRLTTP